MKYKIYSELVTPPIAGIDLKGNEEFLFNSVLELIDFIKEKVDDIDFLEMIERCKEYADEDVINSNPKHFYIDCSHGDWNEGYYDGVFALYNLEKDPEEKIASYLTLSLEFFDCRDSYFVMIKPFIEGAIGNEECRGQSIEYSLMRYFYINSITKHIKK